MSNSTYSDCVASMRTSLSFLGSAVNTLDRGVSDFPRLAAVIKPIRHYELIPQPTLAAAEASLRDEITPFINLLLSRAERQLERQARKIETLKARYELNAGRLSSADAPQRKAAPARKLDGEAALRAKVVRQRKEALKYSVERLEMEVANKEREVRVRQEREGRSEGR